jgi:hypothetical protein
MTPAFQATITDHGQTMPILRGRRQTARHHDLSGLPPYMESIDPETGEPDRCCAQSRSSTVTNLIGLSPAFSKSWIIGSAGLCSE